MDELYLNFCVLFTKHFVFGITIKKQQFRIFNKLKAPSLKRIFVVAGINSMLLVFTALVTECKILLLSSSYTHLTMAAEALVALLYPLKFRWEIYKVLVVSNTFIIKFYYFLENFVKTVCTVN